MKILILAARIVGAVFGLLIIILNIVSMTVLYQANVSQNAKQGITLTTDVTHSLMSSLWLSASAGIALGLLVLLLAILLPERLGRAVTMPKSIFAPARPPHLQEVPGKYQAAPTGPEHLLNM